MADHGLVYSDYGYFWQWDGWQWGRIFPHGFGPTLPFSGKHRIYAYEYNTWFFTNLEYCDVSSIDSYGYGFDQWR